jgi:hypothetical protein
LSPELALHLVPASGEPLVGHLRIVDKFSIAPPTTYVGKEFPKVVQDRKDLIEYRQANLTVPGQSPIPIVPHNTPLYDVVPFPSFSRDFSSFPAALTTSSSFSSFHIEQLLPHHPFRSSIVRF